MTDGEIGDFMVQIFVGNLFKESRSFFQLLHMLVDFFTIFKDFFLFKLLQTNAVTLSKSNMHPKKLLKF